jgi:hypothetical protein
MNALDNLSRIILITSLILPVLSPGSGWALFAQHRTSETTNQAYDIFEIPEFWEFAHQIQALEPPDTIRVRITGDWRCDPAAEYTVEIIDFKEYVRRVLPNEFYYWWPSETLKAGALAVKMYAWYWIERGGKWPDADVLDSTCDQWYRPDFSHPRTDQAVEDIWTFMLTREGKLFETRYKNTLNCSPPLCMLQPEAADLARSGATWDEILANFYGGSQIISHNTRPAGYSFRFSGSGGGVTGRLHLLVDDPLIPWPGPDVDVGSGDFTIEWFMKAHLANNQSEEIACGKNSDWIYGNVLLDRDRPSADERKLGVSLAGGRLVFGVTGISDGSVPKSLTICGQSLVADGQWHHVAIQRRWIDGMLWLFVDGILEAWGQGPAGDIDYPDGAFTPDPGEQYLLIGASRRDADNRFLSYNGWLDELRVSSNLRYPWKRFETPAEILTVDQWTIALYRFDEGYGRTAYDSAGGPGSQYHLQYMTGMNDQSPEWQTSGLFLDPERYLFIPLIIGQTDSLILPQHNFSPSPKID